VRASACPSPCALDDVGHFEDPGAGASGGSGSFDAPETSSCTKATRPTSRRRTMYGRGRRSTPRRFAHVLCYRQNRTVARNLERPRSTVNVRERACCPRRMLAEDVTYYKEFPRCNVSRACELRISIEGCAPCRRHGLGLVGHLQAPGLVVFSLPNDLSTIPVTNCATCGATTPDGNRR
jgi:hypothetical protein